MASLESSWFGVWARLDSDKTRKELVAHRKASLTVLQKQCYSLAQVHMNLVPERCSEKVNRLWKIATAKLMLRILTVARFPHPLNLLRKGKHKLFSIVIIIKSHRRSINLERTRNRSDVHNALSQQDICHACMSNSF